MAVLRSSSNYSITRLLNYPIRLTLAAIVVLLSPAPIRASTPKFFLADTQAAFLKGDVENFSLDVNGQLILGPSTELGYETAAPCLWLMLATNGVSLFVG